MGMIGIILPTTSTISTIIAIFTQIYTAIWLFSNKVINLIDIYWLLWL